MYFQPFKHLTQGSYQVLFLSLRKVQGERIKYEVHAFNLDVLTTVSDCMSGDKD